MRNMFASENPVPPPKPEKHLKAVPSPEAAKASAAMQPPAMADDQLIQQFNALSSDAKKTNQYLDEVLSSIRQNQPEIVSGWLEKFGKKEEDLGVDFRAKVRPQLDLLLKMRSAMKPAEAERQVRQFLNRAVETMFGKEAAAKAIEKAVRGETFEEEERPSATEALENAFVGFTPGDPASEQAFYDRVWERIKAENPDAIEERLAQLKSLGTAEKDLKDDLARQTRGLLNNLKRAAKDPQSLRKAVESFYKAAANSATAGRKRKAA